MSHPERAAFLKQMPLSLTSGWADKRRSLTVNDEIDLPGSCEKIFVALKEYQ